jgi:hypothetical protein
MHLISRWFLILNLILLLIACSSSGGGTSEDGSKWNGGGGDNDDDDIVNAIPMIIDVAGMSPVAMVTAHLNNDTYPDIVTANIASDNVSVLLNDGNGGLDETTYDVGGNAPVDITIADLNGDNFEDIITVNQRRVSVLLGDGNGAFGAPASFDLATNYSGLVDVATGDLDNDNDPDVIVGSADGDDAIISVLLGNGDGTLQAAQPFDNGYMHDDHLAQDLMVFDLDNDNNLDVMTYNVSLSEWDGFQTSFAALPGNGDGTLGPVSGWSDDYLGYVVTTADVDNDGDQDLFSSYYGVLLNNGGTFQDPDTFDFSCDTLYCRSIGATAADMDGDGRLDIATINNLVKAECIDCDADHSGYQETLFGSQGMSILLGNGDGTLADEINIPYTTSIAFDDDVLAVDLNQDGAAEIITIYNGNLAIFSLPDS